MSTNQAQKCAEALEAIRSAGPMNDLERADFDSLRAAEMARAEARRTAPSPQLQLAEVA